MSISHQESIETAADIIEAAGENGFAFEPVSVDDVRVAVRHFLSQASGEDGIMQSVVAKVLPAIGTGLVQLFNVSFACGIFPASWKKAKFLA